MAIEIVLATIMVTDFPAAVSFYERVFGCPADSAAMEGCSEWHLSDGAWIQIFHKPDRAGGAFVSLVVTDIDEHLAALETRGVPVASTRTIPGFVKIATVTDPDGNELTFVQDISTQSAET